MLGMQIVFSLPSEWQDLIRPQVSNILLKGPD